MVLVGGGVGAWWCWWMVLVGGVGGLCWWVVLVGGGGWVMVGSGLVDGWAGGWRVGLGGMGCVDWCGGWVSWVDPMGLPVVVGLGGHLGLQIVVGGGLVSSASPRLLVMQEAFLYWVRGVDWSLVSPAFCCNLLQQTKRTNIPQLVGQ